MAKKILIVLALSAVIYSCSKEDKENASDIPIEENTIVTQNIKKYNFDRARFDDNTVNVARGGSDIMFYGNEEGKLSVAVYDTISKQEIFSWTNDKELPKKLTVDLLYGDIEEYEIEDYFIYEFVYKNNKCAFVLQGVKDSKYILTSGLYFVGENFNKNYTYSYDGTEFNITKWWDWTGIKYWDEDRCLVNYNEAIDAKAGKYIYPVICYSLAGEKLFVAKAVFQEQVSLTDGLNYSISSIERVNIQTGETVWTNEFDSLEGLESDVRVDATSVSSKDEEKIVYKIEYTLISGEKGSREIEIDVETGSAKIL